MITITDDCTVLDPTLLTIGTVIGWTQNNAAAYALYNPLGILASPGSNIPLDPQGPPIINPGTIIAHPRISNSLSPLACLVKANIDSMFADYPYSKVIVPDPIIGNDITTTDLRWRWDNARDVDRIDGGLIFLLDGPSYTPSFTTLPFGCTKIVFQDITATDNHAFPFTVNETQSGDRSWFTPMSNPPFFDPFSKGYGTLGGTTMQGNVSIVGVTPGNYTKKVRITNTWAVYLLPTTS